MSLDSQQYQATLGGTQLQSMQAAPCSWTGGNDLTELNVRACFCATSLREQGSDERKQVARFRSLHLCAALRK